MAEAARANLMHWVGKPIAGSLDTASLDRLSAASHGQKVIASEGTLPTAAAEADLALANAGVRLARSQRVPDLTVGPALSRLETTNDPAAVFSVSIPIP